MESPHLKKGDRGLPFFSILYFLNAVSTAIMYLRTLNPTYDSSSLDLLTLRAYAAGDIPFSVIPGLFVAYGLWRRRQWGWVLALMLNAVYLHSMTVLFTENVLKKGFEPIPAMVPIAIYFFLFAVVSSAYLIAMRAQLRENRPG